MGTHVRRRHRGSGELKVAAVSRDRSAHYMIHLFSVRLEFPLTSIPAAVQHLQRKGFFWVPCLPFFFFAAALMTIGGDTTWLRYLARKVRPEHLCQRREQRSWVLWRTRSSSSSNLCQRLDVIPELFGSQGHKDHPSQNVISMCTSTKTWWSGPCLT